MPTCSTQYPWGLQVGIVIIDQGAFVLGSGDRSHKVVLTRVRMDQILPGFETSFIFQLGLPMVATS